MSPRVVFLASVASLVALQSCVVQPADPSGESDIHGHTHGARRG